MMHTAIVIGCEGIGADTKENSHAQAIFENSNIELLGVMDQDLRTARRAAREWKTKLYDPSVTMITPKIIAVTDPDQKKTFEYVNNNFDPWLIVTEFPLGRNYQECKEIIENTDAPIMVNCVRRYESKHQDIAKAMMPILSTKTLQKFASSKHQVYSCNVVYSSPLDCLHALDYMSFCFGKLMTAKVTHMVKSKNNQIFGFVAEYEGCPQVTFSPIDSEQIQIFEIDIYTNLGKFSIETGGENVRFRLSESGGIREFGYSRKTNIDKRLSLVYSRAATFLRNGGRINCTAKDALKVWQDYNTIHLNHQE